MGIMVRIAKILTLICVICAICGLDLRAAPRQASLAILFVTDLAILAKEGGEKDLARLAGAISSRRQAGELVLGLMGNYWPSAEQGLAPEVVASYLKYIAPQVAVIGEPELGVAPAELKRFLKQAGLAGLTSNIIDRDGCAFRNQYFVLRTSGVKTTLLGVSPTARGKYHSYTLRDPTSTVRGYRNVLSRMRGGVGLTVTLACLPLSRVDRLSADVPAVDLVVSADGNSINAVRDNSRQEGETGRRLVLALGGEGPLLVEIKLSVKRFDPRDWDIIDYELVEIPWRQGKIDEEALAILCGGLTETETPGPEAE